MEIGISSCEEILLHTLLYLFTSDLEFIRIEDNNKSNL